MSWRGIDGVPAAEPLTARAPLPSGAKETLVIPLRHAGTFLCDLRLLGDGQARPCQARALIVSESEPVAVDRDEVLLIEDWRLRPDGTAIAPGLDPKDSVPVYTVNGRTTLDITTRSNQRLRLRFINGCQRTTIAVKIESHERARDGHRRPAGRAVPSPKWRVGDGAGNPCRCVRRRDGDAGHDLIDSCCMTARRPARSPGWSRSGEPPVRAEPLPAAPPLPSNGLPAKLDLKSALRVDLALGGPPGDWVPPAAFAATAAPAFRAKAGRVVVLALTNRAAIATVFHLHGHHFRWLDRLDDGWKPFWLDTLAIEPGQTQRIAFLAEYAGRWLIEVRRHRLGGAPPRQVVQCRVRRPA